MKAKYELEMADMTKELEGLREKWTKSREEAAKTDEELIMAKALLKQKESELSQAMEVNKDCLATFPWKYSLTFATLEKYFVKTISSVI